MKLRVLLLLSFLVIATGNHLEAYPYDKFKDTCQIWSDYQYLPENDENVDVDKYVGTLLHMQFCSKICPRSKIHAEVITRRTEISQGYKETATLFAKGLFEKCNMTVKFLDPREYGTLYSDDPYFPEAVFDPGDLIIYIM